MYLFKFWTNMPLVFILLKKVSPLWIFLFCSGAGRINSTFNGISVSNFSVIMISKRKKIDNTGSFLKVLFLSKSVAKHQKGFFLPLHPKINCFSKALLIWLKTKQKSRFPKFCGIQLYQGMKGISSSTKEKILFTFCLNLFLRTAMPSFNLKYVPVMNVLTDLYLEKCESNAIILSQVRYFIHYFKVYTSIS